MIFEKLHAVCGKTNILYYIRALDNS